MIRLAMRLTAYGRRVTSTDLLWTHVLRTGRVIATFGHFRAADVGQHKHAFVERHGLREVFAAAGEKAVLDLRRLMALLESPHLLLRGGANLLC